MSLDSSLSDFTEDTILTLLASSESSFTGLALNHHHILALEGTIVALADEVEKSHYLTTLLQVHDEVIHFDPMELEDQEERDQAKSWPGWHREGFFDHKSCYSLSVQVVILPHNLCIVDYVIGVPSSLHDSNAFSHTCIYRHPETFLGANEWIWADSTYPSLSWCVIPFKRSSSGSMPNTQKIFNQHLSKVRICSEHFYRSLKGRFQSLQEMRFQIQNQRDLDFANMWI
ncbi:hypothetical protein PISMIDRAFT_16796 [Pisolithus microcarpus 441]|uniref:DDE Tnp4 domain-containing protein n=1 Tax=Pisolithus microcarpus 441 TaxID=765257 RepID=A0A0C9YMF4_9AGAM|nr:hypothetical protein PISMIDRAFT_16796 [Pisolithus microcarpus 441]